MRAGLRGVVRVAPLIVLLALASGGVVAESPNAVSGQSPWVAPHLGDTAREGPLSGVVGAGSPSPRPVGTPSPPQGVGSPGASGPMAATMNAIRAAGVPLRYAFLPDLDRGPSVASPAGLVSPTYTTAPAPIGVADFGVMNRSGTLVAANLSTSGLEGTFAPTQFSGLSMDVGGPDLYGVQLNAVLQDVTLLGNSSYSFWTQNVVEYSPFSHELLLLDNLWNFSSSTPALSTNALYAHGPNGTQVGTTFYYGLGPRIPVGYPFRLSLFLNASVSDNRDVVFFNYTVSNGSVHRAGSYDELEFNSTSSPSGGTTVPPVYVAEGYGVNALGLPDDFEFIIGGPGGGSNFDAFNASAAMGLYYWEAGARVFRVVPSAYDVGGDTGETAAGLASTWAAGADAALGGPPGPAAYLSQGPSFLTGEWNVTNATAGSTVLHLRLAPQNGFTFLAAGTAPSESAFQWVPPAGPYTVVPGEYSVVALASHFIPDSTTLLTAPGSSWLNLTLSGDPSAGVYTPLWALSNADLPNISSSCGGGGCTLWNDESRPLGSPSDGATAYPWFGAFNDFFYPELPGILLWNVTHVVMASPPSLEVLTPSWLRNESLRFGTPSSNDLPTFCYDDSAIRLAGAGAIGGWWFAGSYLGPAAAQASVVFWNTSASLVANNTFLTSGEGLFLYGGTNNTIVGNTFLNYLPLAPDEGSIAGAVAGTAGLFEAERGDGGAGGSGCGCADLVYNNAFGTYFPAIEPTVDPYTGLPPRLPFDARWNVTPTPGPNIVGGTELGGNFWWNYGDSTDPYWVLPYNASGEISTGGDEHPVVPEPLWTVTFVEQGLPTGTSWRVGIDTSTGTAYRMSGSTTVTETWPSGEYFVTAGSQGGTYGIPTTEVLLVDAANVTDILQFYPIFALGFTAVGIPLGGFWTVTVWNSFGSWIDLGNVPDFPAQDLASATYNFTVSSPPGYEASPGTGTVDLVANLTLDITFSATGVPGLLVGQVSPGLGSVLRVDGQAVALGSGGGFSLNLTAGLHSVEATASGYVPYFNNVTVHGGGRTNLSIVLVPEATAGGSLTAGSLELLLAVVSAATLILGGLALVFYRRSRAPREPSRGPPPS